jgi:hypothetical protein
MITVKKEKGLAGNERYIDKFVLLFNNKKQGINITIDTLLNTLLSFFLTNK